MSDSPTASSHTSETSDEFASTTVVDSEDGNDNGDGNGDGNGDEVEDGSRVILSPDEVCEAWDNAGIDESTHEVFLLITGHVARGGLDDQSLSMDDLTELQRFSLDFWTEAFGDNESRTDEQAENLGAFQTALFVGSLWTPDLLEATECLMAFQKRKGEEAAATAAETTVAQGEATEAPQQSDQNLEEDDGWQLLMESLALDD